MKINLDTPLVNMRIYVDILSFAKYTRTAVMIKLKELMINLNNEYLHILIVHSTIYNIEKNFSSWMSGQNTPLARSKRYMFPTVIILGTIKFTVIQDDLPSLNVKRPVADFTRYNTHPSTRAHTYNIYKHT